MVTTAMDTIVAETDGSVTAGRAVGKAASLARSTGARLAPDAQLPVLGNGDCRG